MLSVLILTILAVSQLAEADCPGNQFACLNGKCIEASLKCDGVDACGDNSDESFNVCYNNTCGEQFHRCNYGGCVPMERICDGANNCWDESDENIFLCANDTDIDNLYTKLLGSCSSEFTLDCSKTELTCLWSYQLCDGNYDCSSGYDESLELCSYRTCQSGFLRCKNGACVSSDKFCNHQVDCADGSDEMADICNPHANPHNDSTSNYEQRWQLSCPLASRPGMQVRDYFSEFIYKQDTKIPLKTVVAIDCENGYSNIDSISKCDENGWSSDVNCLRECKQSKDKRNIRFRTQCIRQENLTDCKENIQLLNTTMLVTCAPGYKSAHDPNQVGRHVCNETGLWFPIDANPKCEAVCGIKSTHHPTITPWTVSIFQRISAIEDSYEFKCSGTILSPYIVLTAASCFSDYLSDSHLYFSVVEGDHRVSYRALDEHGYKLHNISDIHPVSYQNKQTVALLNLVKPFIFGAKVRPICLETNQSASGVVVESKGDYSNYTTGQGVTVMNDEKYTLTHLVVSSEMSYDIKAFATAIVNDIAKSESIP